LLNKQILRLALPNIITNISIPLLAAVDLGLMGHLGSAAYIGAVAIGGMIFSFLFWAFGFLRMGTSGFTAQAFGKRDLAEATHILMRGTVVALGIGVLLFLLQWPIAWLAFKVIQSSPTSELLAHRYFAIRIYAAPATLFIYVLTGWFIGMQNARFPMFMTISLNVFNVLLSFLFIKVFGLGSDGVAIANVIGQYFGVLLGVILLFSYKSHLINFYRWREALNRIAFKQFFRVNKDIFIRTLCLIFTLSFFTIQSANRSDTLLAVNTLLFQFFYFFSYFIDGFAFAAEALAGKLIGAKDIKSLRKVVRRLFLWGVLLTAAFMLSFITCGDLILNLLTNNNQLIASAQPFLVWIFLMPLFAVSAFIWDGIYIGATASKSMRNSMLIITLFIFLPAYYLFEPMWGNHGLWLALLLFMGARGLFLTIMAKNTIFKTN